MYRHFARKHPELFNFLRADSEELRIKYAAFLQTSYPINHPKLKDELRLDSKNVYLSPLALMMFLKKKNHFQTLLGLDSFKVFIASTDNFIFNQAVVNKDLQMVENLLQYKEVQEKLQTRNNFALKSALSSNCREIVKLLLASPRFLFLLKNKKRIQRSFILL